MTATHKLRADRRDLFALIASFAALLAECLWLTHGRQPWSDEIFNWILLRDPSLRHMLAAWRLGADGGGLLFYLIARIWMAFFGGTILALRLFNACAIGTALTLLWIAARRWYRFELVAFALPFLWFTAHSVLRQLMVGRFYGLLMAAAALAVLCYALTADTPPTPWPVLLAVVAAHTLLVGVHPFGMLYSAAIVAATIVLDLTRHRLRPRLYLAALGGWWILWPSRAAMQASAAVGKPHFWTTTPHLSDLTDALGLWTDELQAIALFLTLCLIFRWLWTRKSDTPATPTSDAPAIAIGWALFLTIPILWLFSLHGTSYFVDRYLLPSVLGAALLLCATLQRLIPADRSKRLSCALAFAAAAAASGTVYGALWDMPSFFTIPPHTYTPTMAALLPTDKPIVVERVDIFAESITAEPNLPLIYLLDWQTVLLPTSPLGDVSGYNEMQNWQRAGYHAASIQDSTQFLLRQPEFWVVTDPSEQWFRRHIQSNPAYTTQLTGQFQRDHDTEQIWHVLHRSTHP